MILSPRVYVFLISMVPLIELRGAIPAGGAMGLPLWESAMIAVVGSSLPAPFLILFFRKILHLMSDRGIFPKVTEFLHNHVQKRSKKLKSATFIGLLLFVGIPLPSTGAYTGSALSSIMDMRLRDAFPAIFLGNILAAVIMVSLSAVFFH